MFQDDFLKEYFQVILRRFPIRPLYPEILWTLECVYFFLVLIFGFFLRLYVLLIEFLHLPRKPVEYKTISQNHMGLSISSVRKSHAYLHATDSGTSVQLIPTKHHSKDSKFKVILQTVSTIFTVLKLEGDLQYSASSIYIGLILSILSRFTEIPLSLTWRGRD